MLRKRLIAAWKRLEEARKELELAERRHMEVKEEEWKEWYSELLQDSEKNYRVAEEVYDMTRTLCALWR